MPSAPFVASPCPESAGDVPLRLRRNDWRLLDIAEPVGDRTTASRHPRGLPGDLRRQPLQLRGKRVSVMKTDVEGHEHAVVAGGRWFLARHRPTLTIELLEHAERGPIDELLVQDGYLAFAIAPDALRHRDRMMFFADLWNHLLVPAEKAHQVLDLCRKLDLRLEFS